MANKDPNSFLQYTGIAFLLPISAFIGYLMGYGLDHLFHTHFLQWVFLGLGVAAGMIEAIRESQS
jgi:F0F1-type ATP synthase assembly protein I